MARAGGQTFDVGKFRTDARWSLGLFVVGFVVTWYERIEVIVWITKPVVRDWNHPALVDLYPQPKVFPAYLCVATAGGFVAALPFLARLVCRVWPSVRAKLTGLAFILASYVTASIALSSAQAVILRPLAVWIWERALAAAGDPWYATVDLVDYVAKATAAALGAVVLLEIALIAAMARLKREPPMPGRRSTTLVVLALTTCSRPSDLPELTSESEDGIHDLVFALVGGSDGRTLRAKGKHQGAVVGFEVELDRNWKVAEVTPPIALTFQKGTVVLKSIGKESDALARVIDELYETKLAPRGMNAETKFTVISLEGDPANLKAGPVNLKLFFESEDERRYAEAFLNIDVAKGRVELGEKDPDYRTALVLALGADMKKPPN